MDILHIILNWAIPAVLAGVVGVVVKFSKDNRAMKSAMLALIRSQIVSKCERYQRQGELPEYARYCLEELHKEYKSLGGNHGIDKLVDKTFDLPITKS